MSTSYWTESLYPAYGQSLSIDELLFEEKTEHQHLLIFRNALFGNVLVLDGVVQTTEKDEFIYHEMLTHVPLMAHGKARRVLIIGGGDGGILREVCRHQEVTHITQVEIDQAVIDLAKTFFPRHSEGAFEDPRLELVIGDGFSFVHQTEARFDVIISDSTDPKGPAEVLFSQDFYRGCQRCLRPGGILVAQNGVAFMQLENLQNTAARLNPVFQDWHFYSAAVPTYVGGIMCFAWASDNPQLRQIDVETLQQRWLAKRIGSRYYTPAIHQAAFALPQYILSAIQAPGGVFT
ncbi:MAG: polyamine aminopropyltransferase [Pseudomonadales bacterium]|nr:polyamine aminopropyltransferase [Pseudomonadales bacterium]